jgi:hypothetical protein
MWSLWFSLWPVCLLGLLIGFIGVSIVLILFVVRRAHRDSLGREKMRLTYAFLTVVHLLFVGRLLLLSAPDA